MLSSAAVGRRKSHSNTFFISEKIVQNSLFYEIRDDDAVLYTFSFLLMNRFSSQNTSLSFLRTPLQWSLWINLILLRVFQASLIFQVDLYVIRYHFLLFALKLLIIQTALLVLMFWAETHCSCRLSSLSITIHKFNFLAH